MLVAGAVRSFQKQVCLAGEVRLHWVARWMDLDASSRRLVSGQWRRFDVVGTLDCHSWWLVGCQELGRRLDAAGPCVSAFAS